MITKAEDVKCFLCGKVIGQESYAYIKEANNLCHLEPCWYNEWKANEVEDIQY